LDLDPEDLEAIAIIYDQIRQIRRDNSNMKNNNDKQLATDFDNHLKQVMNRLSS